MDDREVGRRLRMNRSRGLLIVLEGIDGTGMRPQQLSGENLEAVVQYVKTLSPAWRGDGSG